jgi:hypothetical protein
VVSDEALGDAGASDVGGVLLEDGAGGEDAGGEGVAVRLGAQLIDGGEDGLAQGHRRGGAAGLGGVGGGPAAHVAGAGGWGPAAEGAPRRRRHRRRSSAPKP